MAIEQKWLSVPPRLFTVDGSSLGIITLANAKGFKVKQLVVISAVSLPDLRLQVKRVISDNQLIVGPIPTRAGESLLTKRSDLSAYTVSLGAFVYAEEQEKAKLKPDDIWQAVYDQEPTVAVRTVGVDQFGRYYETDNPLPVRLSDGSINIGTVNAELEVQLSHLDNSPNPGDVHDSIRIGGASGNELEVLDDKSINVHVLDTPVANSGLSWSYNEVSAIPSGVETTIITVLGAPVQKRIQKIEVSGENVAEIRVKIDGSTMSKKRLWHTRFDTTFDFEQFANGVKLLAGQTLTVTVLHGRSSAGDFETTVWYL